MPRAPPPKRSETKAVIVEPSFRKGADELGADRFDPEPGHELGELEGVGADVRRRPGRPREVRGVPPPDAPVGWRLEELDVDLPDGADLARGDDFARFAHHRKARPRIRHSKEEPAVAGPLDEVAGVFAARRERLVADDVDARIEKAPRDLVVRLVGGGDRDRVDAVGPGALRLRHRRRVRMDPLRIDSPLRALSPTDLRIAGEHPGDQLPRPGAAGRGGVDRADPPPPDDPKPERPGSYQPDQVHAFIHIFSRSRARIGLGGRPSRAYGLTARQHPRGQDACLPGVFRGVGRSRKDLLTR